MKTSPGTLSVLVIGALALALSGCQPATGTDDQRDQMDMAGLETGAVPVYEWDPHWPTRPLPNQWALGNVVGVDVDDEDNVWILHRPRTLLHGHEDDAAYPIPESECCVPAPAVIVFDQAGDVISAWGGPGAEYEWPLFRGQSSSATDVIPEGAARGGRAPQRTQFGSGLTLDYPWPESEHTLALDRSGHVWIGNNGGSHLVQLTRDGEFVRTFGRAGASRAELGSNITDTLNRPAGITVARGLRVSAPADRICSEWTRCLPGVRLAEGMDPHATQVQEASTSPHGPS